MTQALDVDVAVPCAAWRDAVPEAAPLCRRAARAAFAAAGRGGAEVSIVLADDVLVRRLNHDYRGRDEATDVLSFAAGGPAPADARVMLGDVVVAFDTAAAGATAAERSLADHLSHLVVHGMLHLLGHGHETDAEARPMEGLEDRVLDGLGVAHALVGHG